MAEMEEFANEQNRQKKRVRETKKDVEKKMEKLNDLEGVSTLGSLKSEKDLTGYLRRRKEES